MYPVRVQDQLTAQSPTSQVGATLWCCVSAGRPVMGQETSGTSKKFAHRSDRSICLAARLGNPEDRH